MKTVGLMLFVTACSSKVGNGAKCATSSDCKNGDFCVAAVCATLNQSASLSVTDVHGDQATTDPRAPGGFWTKAGLVISGNGFSPGNVSLAVADAAGGVYNLVVASATATTITAAFPSDFPKVALSSTGAPMTLVLSSNGQSVARDLSVLQGPPGADGAAGSNGTPALADPGGGLAVGAAGIGLDATNCNPGDAPRWNGTAWQCEPKVGERAMIFPQTFVSDTGSGSHLPIFSWFGLNASNTDDIFVAPIPLPDGAVLSTVTCNVGGTSPNYWMEVVKMTGVGNSMSEDNGCFNQDNATSNSLSYDATTSPGCTNLAANSQDDSTHVHYLVWMKLHNTTCVITGCSVNYTRPQP